MIYAGRISVVMPAYNAERFVRQAIDSVLAQTCAPCELIVVDDGSTDGTAAMVRAYGGRVRYLYQRNSGPAAARNLGVENAEGEYVAFIDADDRWHPEKLARQLSLLLREPQMGCVYCLVEEIDGSGRVLGQRRGGLRGRVLKEILLREPSGGLCGSTLMLSRERLRGIGGFDVDLPPCEDTDLFWRVAAEYPIDYVPEPLAQHRTHDANAHANVQRMGRAWRRLYRKAFRDPRVRRFGIGFRARCYAGLYYMLSGDQARTGAWKRATAYALMSAALSPAFGFRILRQILDRWRHGVTPAWRGY